MRGAPFALLALLLLAQNTGCEKTSGQTRGAESGGSSERGFSGETQPRQTATVSKRMAEHSAHAVAIKTSIVKGDVSRAKVAATWLAESEWTSNLRNDWRPEMQSLRATARSVMKAETLENAAFALGHVADACASCHLRVAVPLPAPDLTTSADGSERQRRLHAEATDKLWLGLSTPSDEVWLSGARAMALAPLAPRTPLRDGEALSEADTLARRLRDLAGVGLMVAVDRRAATFSEMLGTCARCHNLLGVTLP